MDNRDGQPQWALASATADERPAAASAVVGFEFDAVGGKFFGDLTQANIGKPLAIVLDEQIISAPNINSRITGGSGDHRRRRGRLQPARSWTTSSARSTPARCRRSSTDEPISERTVGPQLGADNLRARPARLRASAWSSSRSS